MLQGKYHLSASVWQTDSGGYRYRVSSLDKDTLASGLSNDKAHAYMAVLDTLRVEVDRLRTELAKEK